MGRRHRVRLVRWHALTPAGRRAQALADRQRRERAAARRATAPQQTPRLSVPAIGTIVLKEPDRTRVSRTPPRLRADTWWRDRPPPVRCRVDPQVTRAIAALRREQEYRWRHDFDTISSNFASGGD